MTPDTIPQTVRFPDLFDKPLVATFDREQTSSDGGAVLLKAAERVYDLVRAMARCLADARAPGRIRHTLEDLFSQRVFGIACGHPDGNDANRLADDPIHKLLLGRDPVSGAPLASQPTVSRFENGVGRAALYAMARELAACVIERHRRRLGGRVRRITVDLDPTDDPTHGAQQLTFFNGHYDAWCYLPLLAFVSFDREAEQYLCAAVLRPRNVPASRGAVGVLARLLSLLRCAFPRARLLVRLDGGFATPEVFDLLDAEPRVTNLAQTPRFVYERVYCARGDIENRIKELLDGLQLDRTSCCRFWANQLRVLLTAAAYVLLQELRLRAARTACARSQVTWLRDRLLKLGAHVVRSVRRIVLHLPRATPHRDAWRRIAGELGARTG